MLQIFIIFKTIEKQWFLNKNIQYTTLNTL